MLRARRFSSMAPLLALASCLTPPAHPPVAPAVVERPPELEPQANRDVSTDGASPPLDRRLETEACGDPEGTSDLPVPARWKFRSFFHRVKRHVADHWHPEDLMRRIDPIGTQFGRGNRLTVLRIRLNQNGELLGSTIENSSGIHELDDEGTEAFRAAQPFSNPPRQLLESDGQIVFRFGFCFVFSPASPQGKDAGVAPGADAAHASNAARAIPEFN